MIPSLTLTRNLGPIIWLISVKVAQIQLEHPVFVMEIQSQFAVGNATDGGKICTFELVSFAFPDIRQHISTIKEGRKEGKYFVTEVK